MLNFVNLSLRRGTRLLFASANFSIHDGQKVGITGANGSGKSSLLALVRGEIQPDEGDFTRPPDLVIAHVLQETPAHEMPAIEYVLQGDHELAALRAELAAAEVANDGTRQARVHGRIEAIDGYTADSRAGRLLHGLGFTPAQIHTPVREFSGGWRMRLNLAQALMCRSDLLLLDEPTNHLDLDAVIWLEQWLRAYRGTLLLIAHDRDFLDQVVDHVAHIEHGGIELYRGNYSRFEQRRAERLALQQATHAAQQREIARVHRFVERFRAQASKARQVQSRLKALAAMETVAPAHVDTPFHFGFRRPEKLPNPLLRLHGAAAGYPSRTVLSGLKLSLAPGDRIGLLGANGAGKSTLVKLLAGELRPLAGSREEAPDVRIGYFAQHQLEQLQPAQSPLEHLQRLDPRAREQDLRDYLGGFGYPGEMTTEAVAPRSGGEKARLVLALIVYQRPNLLLLDEPTNHLDLEMRHALTIALQEFEGAMVLVAHDRHLLRTSTERLLLVADGGLRPFAGDLEDYGRWLTERRNAEADRAVQRAGEASSAVQASAATSPLPAKERRRREAERRRRLEPLRSEVQRLERQLERLHEAKKLVEEKLADPSIYEETAGHRVKELLREQGRLQKDLERAEERWIAAHEELDTARS